MVRRRKQKVKKKKKQKAKHPGRVDRKRTLNTETSEDENAEESSDRKLWQGTQAHGPFVFLNGSTYTGNASVLG